MSIFSRLSSLARDLRRRPSRDSEIEEEIREYARLLAQEKERGGMGPEEARRTA